MNGYTKIISAMVAVISILGAVLFTAPSSYALEDTLGVTSLSFFADSALYTSADGGYQDVAIPLYADISWNKTAKTYISGFIAFSPISITFRNSDGTSITPAYFTFADGVTGRITGPLTSSHSFHILTFDNLSVPNTTEYSPVLIGYYHFSFNYGSGHTASNIIPFGTSPVTVYNAQLRNGDTFVGLENVLKTALDGSTSFQQMLEILDAIDSSNVGIRNALLLSNTNLSSIISKLESLVAWEIECSTTLDDIFYIVNSITSVVPSIRDNILTSNTYLSALSAKLDSLLTKTDYTNTALFSLIVALTGAVPGDPADYIYQSFTDRMIYIISSAITNGYTPSIDFNFGDSATNISNSLDSLNNDLNLSKPNNFVDISDDYLASIDTSFNSSVFGWLNNPVIITMLCLVISIGGLSFLLYGKK